MTADLECPYCGADHEICHDDGFGYAEGSHEDECFSCGKKFIFETSISFYYEPMRADCLNGGEHSFRIIPTYLVERTRKRCAVCEHEAALTEEEMQQAIRQDEERRSRIVSQGHADYPQIVMLWRNTAYAFSDQFDEHVTDEIIDFAIKELKQIKRYRQRKG